MYLAQTADPTQSVIHRSCHILDKFSEVWLPNAFLHHYPSSIQECKNTKTGERLFKQCMGAIFSDKFTLLNPRPAVFVDYEVTSLFQVAT